MDTYITVVKNMFAYRGFASNEITVDENNENFKLLITAIPSKKGEFKKSYVNTAIIFIDDKINKGIGTVLKKYLNKIPNHNKLNRLIIVTKRNHIRIKKNDTLYFRPNNLEIRIYPSENLKFNILNHKLVPFHSEMIENEIKTLADKYETPFKKFIHQLPRIGIHDPVVMYLGGRNETVYRITRLNGSIYYRCCIDDFGTE
jgi:DNA-directed RNA polymerase subunit H (RpoH/RPB5)